MFLLGAQNNFYIIEFICRRACEKKSSLNFMSSVGFWASKIWMFFGKNFVELVWKLFSGRNNSLEPLFFDFLTVFHMVWKNQESCESCLVGFWVSRHSKMQRISANNFFCLFKLPLWIY